MNLLPWYKAYPRDFLDATVGMSLELKGAYRIILDLIYLHDGQLRAKEAEDLRYLAGHLGCSLRKCRALLAELSACGKLEVGEVISNKRAENELIIQRKSRENNAENRARSNENNDLRKQNTEYRNKKIKNKKGGSSARLSTGFTAQEREEAGEVMAWIVAGREIKPEAVPRRVRDCLIAEQMLSPDELIAAGLMLRN